MNPNTVFSASLVASLVLWFPSMQACLRGDLDLAPAGLRYLAALVVSRLALNGLARLVNAYRSAQADRSATDGSPAGLAPSPSPAAKPLGSDPAPQRRRSDASLDGEVDPATLAA
ncbi:MAG TPA: hypothetical protein VGR20_05930 [Acidimicrobiia bacterium]|jgi:hypothetical protein|nr:hypothetical protein [Acidimicrobiia bacterium]